jgi:hypothetical protein
MSLASDILSDVYLARWEGGEHMERLVFAWFQLAMRTAEETCRQVNWRLEQEELRQEVYLAIVEAVHRYEEERGSWAGCLSQHVRVKIHQFILKSRGGKFAGASDWELERANPATPPPAIYSCLTCSQPFTEVEHVCHGMCKTCCRQKERVKQRTGHPGICPYCIQVLRFPRMGGTASDTAMCASCGYRSSELEVCT